MSTSTDRRDILKIGIDPGGINLENRGVRSPAKPRVRCPSASKPWNQPQLMALPFQSFHQEVVRLSQLWAAVFILTIAIKTHTWVLFLYPPLSNFGTWFPGFNHFTEHSRQTWAPPHPLPQVIAQSKCFLLKWHCQISAGWTSQRRQSKVRCGAGGVFFKAIRGKGDEALIDFHCFWSNSGRQRKTILALVPLYLNFPHCSLSIQHMRDIQRGLVEPQLTTDLVPPPWYGTTVVPSCCIHFLAPVRNLS